MRIIRLIMPLLLIASFGACKKAVSPGQQAATRVREANELLGQGTKATEEWSREYMKAFNPRSRAQFPGNRDQLRSSADKIVKALDESTRLNNSALEKYEQGLALMSEGQQRRGMSMLVSAIRKETEVNKLMKAQVQLVYDEKIVDAKTFDAKFLQIVEQTMALRREHEAVFNEGRRLLGM